MSLAALVVLSAVASRHFSIGLQLYSVRDDCARDLAGTLSAVAKMGYEGVEMAGTYGKPAEEWRKMLAEDHLKAFGAHVDLEELLPDRFDKTVAYYRAVGIKMLVVPSLSGERRSSKKALDDTADTFSAIARKLAPLGMTLAFHDEADMFRPVEGDVPWVVFFKRADPRVKIEFDTGNALEGGAQAAPYVSMFPGRTISTHMKDYSATKPAVLLGDGDEDWKAAMPLFKGAAGVRYFIVEQETYPFPPLESCAKDLANLRRMLGEHLSRID